MHICLPDTREARPAHGSAYLLYNVHIDGLYHCSLRFKQLLHLHQALSKKFTSPYHQLPQFPPKKLLPLSASQVEERRQLLEKYLQNISQDKAICNSSIFNLFLLEAQRESTRIRENQVHLDIELVNGQKIRLQIKTHDSADAVLTAVCRALGLDDRYHAYFCLCLCGYDVIRDKLIIKRRLSFFESPYVTLQMAIQQQEQLQNVLTNYSNTTINNNINTNSCRCQSCYYQQQLLTNSTSVPLISSSSGSFVNSCNSSGHYNQEGDNNHQYHNQNFYTNLNGRQSTSSGCTNCSLNNNNNNSPSSSYLQGPPSTTFVTHRILLRKSYWDPIYDTYILNDQQALNLLFIQTVYDIKHSLMFVDKETYHQLESLLAADSKMEYILLARTLKYYNYVHFEPCYSDYPRPRTKVMISIGSKELNMRVLKSPKSLTSSSSAITTTTSTSTSTITPPNTQVASSATSTSSSSTSSTASTIISNNNNNTTNNQAIANQISPLSPASNQQVSLSSEQQILYCTSSLVPSGYQHLITKDDLVEEEYNFKVPLIRCWRLTSLETLNSNHSNPSKTPPHAQVPKTLSFFGSSSSSSSSGNSSCSSNNENRPIADCNCQLHRTIISSGNGGLSLMAALTGGRNGGLCRTTLNTTNSNNNNPNGFNGNHHQHCQHENHSCSFGPAMDHTQFSQYELSFEYLVSKDTLRWVTISSDQAIFISISLQGVVDELVSKRDVKASNYKGTSDAPNILPAVATNTAAAQEAANGNVSNNNIQKSSSFTYMYRDGTQKLLNTSNQQLIDKFGTTLGYSPSNPYAMAMARQRQQIRSASSGSAAGLFLSNGSRLSAALGSFGSSTSSSPPEQQYQHIYSQHHLQYQQQQQHAFEITNLKKAPSPIINDAFEGVTNEDDL